MSTTTETTATTDQVWQVLADGWTYATWVVGASRIRAVASNWPAVGSRIHHSVGLWPLVLSDHTESTSVHEGRELVMSARALPFGAASITLRLHPLPTGCRIEMIEHAQTAPFTAIPKSVQHALAHPRNLEAVRRLALLAERSSTPS